jgi:hypothetical protein
VSTSDVPFVTRRHTRVGILVSARCAVRNHRSSRMVIRSLTYESEDFCFVSPVRERRASARERLSSYREPTSRDLQDVRPETVREPVHTRTVSPSVHPRPASGGATNFFPASALFHHSALRPTGREDTRCDRPMSATHTNYVHPHLARFQLALAAFAAGTPHRVLGSVALTGGPSVSRHPRPLRRIVMRALFSNLLPHGLLVTSVGVFFPRR